jgi:hypothetical protein
VAATCTNQHRASTAAVPVSAHSSLLPAPPNDSKKKSAAESPEAWTEFRGLDRRVSGKYGASFAQRREFPELLHLAFCFLGSRIMVPKSVDTDQ